MKFLAMHITNQKLRFDVFTVQMEHDFWHKIKMIISLSICTNIPVLQGHSRVSNEEPCPVELG